MKTVGCDEFFYESEVGARASRALGVPPVRLEIIRLLVSKTELSTSQLMDASSLTRNGIYRHLRVLCAEGLITERHATHPRGSGPITYWRIDVDEVLDLLDALANHLAGA